MNKIWLASKSPRRRGLLTNIGVAFDVLDTDVDETPEPGELPAEYAVRIARLKATAGWEKVMDEERERRPVLSADTTLDLDHEIIGKPVDADDAARILQRLSGRAHHVLTAVAVARGARIEHVLNVSEVRFAELDSKDIAAYVASGEPLDKAGAYGIQGKAGLFVAEIRGSYTGIMGLPVYETGQLLRRFGITL